MTMISTTNWLSGYFCLPQTDISRLIKVEMILSTSLRICVSTFLVSLIVLVKPTNAVTYKTVADLVLIEKIDLTDLYNQSIILQRCAGLYGAFAKILPNEDSLSREETFNASMVMLALATAQMAQKRGLPLEDPSISDEVEKAFKVFMEIYFRDMENTQILTGSIFNELLKIEFSICKRFLNNKNDEKDSDGSVLQDEVTMPAPNKSKKTPETQSFVTSYYTFPDLFIAKLKGTNVYLQATIGVSTQYDETVIYNVEAHHLSLRSDILATITEHTLKDIEGKAGRDALAKKIMAAINKKLEELEGFGGVEGVYYTSFVLQ